MVSRRSSLRSGVSKLFWQGVSEHVRIQDRKVRLPRQPKMCLGPRECTYSVLLLEVGSSFSSCLCSWDKTK